MMASSICSPVGSLQSSGTGTLAHSNRGSHGLQSIPVAGAVLDAAVVTDVESLDAAVVAAEGMSGGSSPHAAITRARVRAATVAVIFVVVTRSLPLAWR